ncbi:unnamed protein product [Calicophoron daubneyi]|uniref:Activating signal cointegrator 1 n=1 Tax=Calicophoron daubneyi TaxID=300641 RepID=A0AAV2TB17_CALDB
MDKVKKILTAKLGEENAENFIRRALAVDDIDEIRLSVASILNTRLPEYRLVYKVLAEEKDRKDAFPEKGYRKTDTNPNAPCEILPAKEETKTAVKQETAKQQQPTNPKNKKKKKFQPLFHEGAQNDHLVSLLPGRHPCQCLATKHSLVNNCTSCGRIVCAQEGSGPCFFCGSLVCSREEMDIISRDTKNAQKLRNRLAQAGWAPGTETPLYRLKRKEAKKSSDDKVPMAKVDNGFDGNDTEDEEEYRSLDECSDTEVSAVNTGAQQRLEEGLAAALAKRDRLLEYDANSTRRTKVLDDEMDYFITEGGGQGSSWLNPEARARIAQRVAELRAQRHASRLLNSRFCLDFMSGALTQEDTRDEAARQLYQPDDSELKELQDIVSGDQNKNDEEKPAFQSNETIADPSLGIKPPKFIPQALEGDGFTGSLQRPQNPLLQALREPMSELRMQDENSRQLSDEGYCLSMHQPWASFLVRGIKRDEGRVWYTTHRGCLWIASTAKRPSADEIRDMEETYLRLGVPRSDLPASYPTGCLLGRVNVVDVLSQEEYREKYPNGLSESPYVFVCDDPHEVLIKFPITGKHKIYKLPRNIHLAAAKNLA